MTKLIEYELSLIAEAVVQQIERKYFLIRKAVFTADSIPLQFKILQGAMQFISEKYAITIEQLCTAGKTRQFSQPRMEYCFLISKHYPEISLHKIGSAVNIKHCTVIHAKKTIQDRMDVMKDYRATIEGYAKEFPEYIKKFVNKQSINQQHATN